MIIYHIRWFVQVIGKLFVDLQHSHGEYRHDAACRNCFNVLQTILQNYKSDLGEEFVRLMDRISAKVVHWEMKANALEEYLDNYQCMPLVFPTEDKPLVISKHHLH